MAARTALTLLQMSADGNVAQGAGATPDASNGNTIADPPGPFGVFLIVKNADSSSHTCTVRAGGNGVTASGGTNPGVPFEAAGVGDLVVTVANGTTQIIGPFTTDRFCQADGSLSIDWSASTSMTVWAVETPKPQLILP